MGQATLFKGKELGAGLITEGKTEGRSCRAARLGRALRWEDGSKPLGSFEVHYLNYKGHFRLSVDILNVLR